VTAGVRRARAKGRKLGRRPVHRVEASRASALLARGMSLRAVGRVLGVHPTIVSRALAAATVAAPAVTESRVLI
jgi:DNA invertase Pin-like site-specific DNA recombinase